MSHKFQNFKIKFFETFSKATCKVFEILDFIIIILIMAEMVKVIWYVEIGRFHPLVVRHFG
jgi:hypothetical protein